MAEGTGVVTPGESVAYTDSEGHTRMAIVHAVWKGGVVNLTEFRDTGTRPHTSVPYNPDGEPLTWRLPEDVPATADEPWTAPAK